MIAPAFIRLQGRATDWFTARSSREQLLLGGLAALAVATVFVTGVWTPLQASRDAVRTEIRTYETVAARLRAAGPTLAVRPTSRSGSPATIITDTAAAAGLTLQRLEPEGGLTRVALEDVEFDKLMRWLDRLEADGALRLADLKLDRRPAPGVVNAQLTLAGR